MHELEDRLAKVAVTPAGSVFAKCIFPCPSSTFTTEQYNQQFIAYTVPGLVALVLHATMFGTV